jgi:putative oxidoreductase
MEWLKKYDNYYLMLGRTLLGLYFIGPGMTKVAGYQGYLDLMASKSVPLVEVLLPLTILIQVGAGLFLIAGKNLRVSALLLFGLTILINLFIHNFWALAGDPGQAHETQNFVKNLAIAAGLLVLATKDKS